MNSNQILVCEERGKLEFKGKNQSEQRTNTFNPHMTPRLGHIGGRQVLSPPHHPCSLRQTSQTVRDISAKLSKNAIEMELKKKKEMTITFTIELEIWSSRVLRLKWSGTAEEIVKIFITYGAKLLSADWLKHRAYFS